MKRLAWPLNRGRIFRELALAAGTGALSAFGQPGVGLAPLFLTGLAALAFLAARAPSRRAAVGVGLAWGAGVSSVVTIGSVGWGGVVPVALTVIGTMLYAVPQSLLTHWTSQSFSAPKAFAVFAAAWTLCMDFSGVVGFPTQGEALSAIACAPWLMAGARLCGSSVLCGLIVAGTSGVGARLATLATFSVRALAEALPPLAVSLALLVALAVTAHATAPAAHGTLTAGVPQLDIPADYFKLRMAVPEREEAFEALFSQQIQELADVDLLALPETYDGAFPLLVPRLRQSFQRRARLQHQAWLLSSYLVAADGGGYNAVGAINAEGQLVGVHRKVNLAPFGEVELERGHGFQPSLVLPGARVGVLICQESLLSEGPRELALSGANLLVTPTSDISFGSGLLSFEHLAGARLRSIEVGRAMVWASAGGPSGAIDRWGNFAAGSGFREAAAARVQLETHDDTTPYLSSIWLWRALSALTLLWFGLTGRKARVSPPQPVQVSTRRGLFELAVALLAIVLANVASPALVELAAGNPARAKRSVLELLGAGASSLGPASLDRFRTDAAHSASGALAYYLTFYGLRTLPSGTELTTATPTLREIARTLATSFAFPAREVALDFSALPRSGALVETHAHEFGFLTSNRLGLVALFLPTRGRVLTVTDKQAATLLERNALMPASDPELDRFGR